MQLAFPLWPELENMTRGGYCWCPTYLRATPLANCVPANDLSLKLVDSTLSGWFKRPLTLVTNPNLKLILAIVITSGCCGTNSGCLRCSFYSKKSSDSPVDYSNCI